MKKVIRLTESDLTRIVKRVMSESSFGNDMLSDLYGKLSEKYPNAQYDKGIGVLEPYIYIPINEKKKTGLLIEFDGEYDFEIHYDNGIDDRIWNGWKKDITRLNSPKHAAMAVDLFMKRHKIR
jgi:hypothetical protein